MQCNLCHHSELKTIGGQPYCSCCGVFVVQYAESQSEPTWIGFSVVLIVLVAVGAAIHVWA